MMLSSSHENRIPLSEFGQHLILELAVPVLAEGYSALVKAWKTNPKLKALAQEKGVDAIFSGDTPELTCLRKSNRELVTGMEKEAERRMTEAVRKRFPADTIIGEELGVSVGRGRRWVFDPVDGTSAMLRTALAEACDLPLTTPAPAFGITVGIVEGDDAILGLVTQLLPEHGTLVAGNTWIGEKDKATLCDGVPVVPLHTRAELSVCGLASTVPQVMFNTLEKWSGYQALMEASHHMVPDQNCIGFMRLLQDKSDVDIVYEADLAYHDVAALVPILQGGGIVVSDREGQSLSFPENAIAKEFNIVAAQAFLHAQALSCIQKGVALERNRFAGKNNFSQGYASKFES